MVAIKDDTRVVDVTGMAVAMSATNEAAEEATLDNDKDVSQNNKKKRKLDAKTDVEAGTSAGEVTKKNTAEPAETANAVTLPKGLQQLEIRVPSDEKDTMTYLFLLKVCHFFENNFILIHF